MTLNIERRNSILMTKQFLYDLLDPKKTKRVPRRIREIASSCLRHYPTEIDVEILSIMCPTILGTSFKDNFSKTKQKRKKK